MRHGRGVLLKIVIVRVDGIELAAALWVGENLERFLNAFEERIVV